MTMSDSVFALGMSPNVDICSNELEPPIPCYYHSLCGKPPRYYFSITEFLSSKY